MPTTDETCALVLGSGILVARMLRTLHGERAVSVDEAILAADRHVIVNDYPPTV